MKDKLRPYFRGRLAIAEISDHSILIDYVNPKTVVLDLGANHGHFSRHLAELSGCQCYLVEANPSLAAELAREETFAGVLHAAASGRCQTHSFSIADCDLASRVLNAVADDSVVQVPGLDYAAILAKFGLSRVDVLKLGIEGSELSFIDAMSDEQLREIDQITIEFHDFIGLYARSEVTRILRRAKMLGYENMSPNYGSYDILLINRRRINNITSWDYLYAAVWMRPALRLLRALSE